MANEYVKSTHRVEVVPVKLEPHPNADTLSIVKIFDGYICVVRTEDWQGREYGAYVPPDSLVDVLRPQFSFLDEPGKVGAMISENGVPVAGKYFRIKAKKLRGIVSMGLLIPLAPGFPPASWTAEDLTGYFGVRHYDPPESLSLSGQNAPAPSGFHPKYDIDSLRRFAHVFEPGEMVHVTEKIHGANARYCWQDGEMHVGRHGAWFKKDSKCAWWKVLEKYPSIESYCRKIPGLTVYGELYGWVQDLRYGHKQGEVSLAVFDVFGVMTTGECVFIDADLSSYISDLPWVPFLTQRPFDLEEILELAEGPSLIPGADHIREGIVVKPIHERIHSEIGRVCLKVVSNGYMLRK